MTPIPDISAPATLSQDELRAEFRALLHEKMRTAI